MITLKTVEDQAKAKQFYEKENLIFNKNSDCLCAKENEKVLGYCLFDIETDKITLRAIEPQNDLMLLDGILRSTLHIAANRNISKAIFTDNSPEDLFRKLGFVQKDNTLKISKIFENDCCGCK